MIELGKKQTLKIVREKAFGVYLGTEDDETQVLLPKKYVPAGAQTGDMVEVFIYRDSDDRLIASTKMPPMEIGGIAPLTVSDVGKIGAFLSWNLDKDLFLPFKEQTCRPEKGRAYPVALYTDKSDRLCATMNLYDYLQVDPPYKKNDQVTGTIYQINERVGAFVAVDLKYHGMISIQNFHGHHKVGDEVSARVVKVRSDGKLELSLSAGIDTQMDLDAARVMDLLASYDGVLPFTEKASPAVIEREIGMSKAAFKRAVGRLLRQQKITIEGGKIKSI